MSKTERDVDALDAIAVGLSALSDAKPLNRFNERARAGLIEKSLNEFGFVIVPKLVRGETPRKVAAWRAFLKHMGAEMPRNPDGTYNGSFDVAMQAAIDAYITAPQKPKP